MSNGKNSYRLVGHNFNEDSFYGNWVGKCKDVCDTDFTEESELCYECIDIKGCYDCNFCQECRNCNNSWFLYDCIGCNDCFMCVNLRQKQYYILNEPYSREEYFAKVAEYKKWFQTKGLQAFYDKLNELKLKYPHHYLQGYNNENSYGEHIFNSRNAKYCFDVNEVEDSMYASNAFKIKDCYDVSYIALDSELNYMCHSSVQLRNSNFCDVCWYSNDLEYCEFVFNSHDCFGCVSLNHAEYRILNEQYQKEDYFAKVAKIKEELRASGEYGNWYFEPTYDEYLALSL